MNHISKLAIYLITDMFPIEQFCDLEFWRQVCEFFDFESVERFCSDFGTCEHILPKLGHRANVSDFKI